MGYQKVAGVSGIYEGPTGFRVQVHGGRGKGNTRFFTAGTAIGKMTRWQRDREAELTTVTPEKPASQRDTLKADIPRALALVPEGAQRDTFDSHLSPWLKTPLASMRRADITREDIKRQLAMWGSSGGRSGTGYAASTLNHRLSALRRVYQELDPDGAPNPTAGIRKFREPDPEPRGVPFAVADAILAQIKDRGGKKAPIRVTLARVRLRVICYTGFPHKQVMQIKREHIDFDGGTILTTPRRKGGGAKARRLPLLPDAVEALRDFDRLNAYGAFSTSPVRRAWNLARDRVAAVITDPQVKALLAELRPYDLRHSFGTEVYRASRDHRATAELLLHAPGSKLTERYTLAAVSETAQRALAAVQQARNLPAASSNSKETVRNTKEKRQTRRRRAAAPAATESP